MKWPKSSRGQRTLRRRVLSIFHCFKNSTRTVFSSSSGKTKFFEVLPRAGARQEVERRKLLGICSPLWKIQAQSTEGVLMKKIFLALLIPFLLNTSTEATDKIRIGVPVLGAQFITLPLAKKMGFLKEEGLEAEVIRISGSAASSA